MESAIINRGKFAEPAQVKSLFTTNGDYELTRRSVTSLLYLQEDEDFVRPTQYALDLTLNLLEDANSELVTRAIEFPRGSSSTSERGGIYVFWEECGKSVQLEVPAKHGGMFYIHVTGPNESQLNKDVSAKALAAALVDAVRFDGQRLGTQDVPAFAASR